MFGGGLNPSSEKLSSRVVGKVVGDAAGPPPMTAGRIQQITSSA